MKAKSSKGIVLAPLKQSQNEQKGNELYIKYKEKVYCLALSFVKDNYLAEDLSHEILMKCYLTLEKFNGNCTFQSWIYRIAINHCIDFLRKGYRHRDLFYENTDLFTGKEGTPETDVFNNFRKEELLFNLRQLPPNIKRSLYSTTLRINL
ncbi:RNA polymerase sigma factor [Bacillus salitolerans]|uniref:RNA polymerase sigma factor n=1 Tax=Bacillus salitolerans TaxID=1437434 RepID=A0ABW4LQC1_9BACI